MITYIPRQWLRAVSATFAVGLVLFFVQTPHTLAQPPAATAGPALTVDAAADNHPINPDIYGMNFADPSLVAELNLPVNRWGGNAVSRYNYTNDISNHAMDWYFENIREGNGADPQEDSAANRFIETNNASGTKTLLTVPTIGYVSKNDANACGFSKSKYHYTPGDYDWQWRPDCGNGIEQANGQKVTGNDPLDTSIVADPTFVQGWVNYLHTHFGASAPEYYALDNEPDLWYETHRDVHPLGASYQELFDRGRDYAAAIKAIDDGAMIFGPVAWGWTGYFYSAKDISEDRPYWNKDVNSPDRWSHANTPFLEWYLQQMAAYEADPDHPTRLLDYLDIHFYPQTGVALSKAGDSILQTRRLRGTRSLWDPNYFEKVDGSWIDEPVMLIPRMHDWVDNNYPGTMLALTEYNWGGLEDINGALAQADILGIFGRERLDLATIWDPPGPDQPGAYAFRMYLNYDGAGGKFGDTAIQASSANQDKLAIYGSKDTATGDLKLMVINKTSGALTSSLTLNNFTPASCAAVYTYSPANLHAILPSWTLIEGSAFSASFPGNSITLMVIPPGSAGCNAPPSAKLPSNLSAPKRGGATPATQPKFKWRAAKGAKAYLVEVSDNPDFINPIIDERPAWKNVFVPPSALGYETYYWRVRTLFADGITEYSQPATFDLTLLKTPKNNQVLNSGKSRFTWTKVNGVTTYHIQVADNPDFSPWLVNQDVTGVSLKSPMTLEPGLYYWRVKTPTSAYTPTWTFFVTPAKTPKDGHALATTRPRLIWGKMPGAHSYHVQILPDDPPGPPVDINTALTSATSPTLAYGRYSWRIEADTGGGFTPPLSFEVTFLKKPSDGAFLTTRPTFQWVKVAGAGSYHLELFAGIAPGGTSYLSNDGAALSFKPPALPRGPYYWRVSANTGQTAPMWSFVIGP